MVCYEVEVEPVLQEIIGEMLPRGVKKAPDSHPDVHARGFWDRQSSAFFDVRVYHLNAESYNYVSKYIASMKMGKKTLICKESYGNRARDIYSANIHNYRRNGESLQTIPQWHDTMWHDYDVHSHTVSALFKLIFFRDSRINGVSVHRIISR